VTHSLGVAQSSAASRPWALFMLWGCVHVLGLLSCPGVAFMHWGCAHALGLRSWDYIHILGFYSCPGAACRHFVRLVVPCDDHQLRVHVHSSLCSPAAHSRYATRAQVLFSCTLEVPAGGHAQSSGYRASVLPILLPCSAVTVACWYRPSAITFPALELAVCCL